MDIKKTFIGSRMNKALDERLIPNGEYTDALNIRISSDEDGEAGSVENAKGNEEITTLMYQGQELLNAVCIGTIADDSKETIYWFVTSPTVDMIVSFNVSNSVLKYHVVSETVLNFNELFPINGVNLIDNLLFFTDNLNPPRRINVDRTYNNVTEDDISVIVKPPIESPVLNLISSPSYNNYMEDKFIRFCYRYRYKDGEYSAISQFSDLAFSPGQFELDYTTYDMIGMRNVPNIVDVTFNTGSKNVVGVDLCFKLSNSNVISVISRYDKDDEGWPDDDNITVTFDNQKIYTTLQESELLRLYDNVPRRAKSQTILGSRLFYGNYVDGYDIDEKIKFDLELLSEDLGAFDANVDLTDGIDYTIETTKTVVDSTISVDLSGIELKAGGSLYINLDIQHDSFGGDASYVNGTEPLNNYRYTYQFILPRDYVSVADLATDTLFLKSVELTDTVLNASDGYSLSDLFFASILANGGWTVSGGGVTSNNQGFLVSSLNNNLILQVPAVEFENGGVFAYEYFDNLSSTSAQFIEENARQSLHSNRDYEVAMVYLDEYNRATTALVDTDNTVHVPANFSDLKNSINVTIKNDPPDWASRYRFVMKCSKGSYDTIYSNLYFFDDTQSSWWLRLEGDNQTKAKVGDTLYVKRDSEGATNAVVKCKVLDIEAQEKDFISGTSSPAGLYMRIKNAGFSIDKSDFNDFDLGSITAKNLDALYETYINTGTEASPIYEEVAIAAGSQVRIYFRNNRNGSGNSCRKKRFTFDRTFVSTQDYSNLYDFIVGQNINFNNPTNDPAVDSSGDVPTAQFISTIGNENNIINFSNTNVILNNLTYERYDTKIAYYRHTSNGKAWLGFQNGLGRGPCNGNNHWLDVHIQVFSAGGLLVFETEPADVNNEIYFEGHKSYPIIGGFHTGDIQNQTDTQDCIVSLDIYNCFTFGNGVESFKINDSISLPGFNIGERVTAVARQEYKEAHRYSDVTYSGVYNEETNINNLNVFNLGLVNYRLLERLFGPINRMHGRQTDIMVLQEDKISYLLAGKNLLSDAAGGSTLTSVPEVLGTQISRIEEFGISDDADSFDSFGYDIFFTDTKRGAVINIKGGSAQSDQLNVISMFGMRTWFRDRFIENQNTFKIGAYDPYHQEYVLHISDIEKIVEPDNIECGVRIKGKGNYKNETINTSTAIGSVDVDYTVSQSTNIKITYDNNLLVNQNVTGTGTLTFSKNLQSENKYAVEITTVGDWEVNFGCVESEPLTIIKLVSGDINQEGLLTQQNHFWFNADQTSPESAQDVVEMQQEPVSLYRIEDGFESEGYFPAALSTVTMRGVSTINRQYNITNDKMLYLISDTLYNDIGDILPLATEIQNVLIQGGTVTRSFLYDNPNNFRYLYMIWRYTTPNGIITNTAPFAYNNIYNTQRNVAVFITLTGFDPDGDALTFSVVTNPSHGTLSGTAPNLTYTPDLNYTGTDSFTFKVNDGTVDSNIATVSIVVSEPPSLTAFSVTITGDANEANSCSSMAAVGIRFHDGAGAYPTVGDFIYESTGGSNYELFDGQDLWYRMDNNETIRIQTSPLGRVIQKTTC